MKIEFVKFNVCANISTLDSTYFHVSWHPHTYHIWTRHRENPSTTFNSVLWYIKQNAYSWRSQTSFIPECLVFSLCCSFTTILCYCWFVCAIFFALSLHLFRSIAISFVCNTRLLMNSLRASGNFVKTAITLNWKNRRTKAFWTHVLLS